MPHFAVAGAVICGAALTAAVLAARVPAAPSRADVAIASLPCKPRPASAVVAPLTKAQCVTATRLAKGDPYLRALVAGHGASFGKPEAWGGCGPRGIIGAVIEVRFARPLYVRSTSLPTANFPSESEPGYGGCSYSIGRALPRPIAGATKLRVHVEFKRRAVIWVTPLCPAPPGSISRPGGLTGC